MRDKAKLRRIYAEFNVFVQIFCPLPSGCPLSSGDYILTYLILAGKQLNKDFLNLHTDCMKKRFIAVILSVAASTCFFAGCGGKRNETEERNIPDTIIKREAPDLGKEFEEIMPVPPKHKIPKPIPLPAPDRQNGIRLK